MQASTYIGHVFCGNTENIGGYPCKGGKPSKANTNPFASFNFIHSKESGHNVVSNQRNNKQHQTVKDGAALGAYI